MLLNNSTNHDIPDYLVQRVSEAPSLHSLDWIEFKEINLVEATEGKTPVFATTVRMCWTFKQLCVLFDCEDSFVQNDYWKRDDPIYEQEVVEIFLAPGESPPQKYFEFEISPFNIQFDAIIHNPTGHRREMTADVSWDAKSFISEVQIRTDISHEVPNCIGWKALMKLSFRDIGKNGKAPSPGDIWRANLYRIEQNPTEEFQAWSPTLETPANFHIPSRFGRLIFE